MSKRPADRTWSSKKGEGEAYRWLVAHVGYDSDECLIWPFCRNEHGRGQFGYLGKHQSAHRFMCELVKGPAPSRRHHAAHSCGNGRGGCVNPKHLSWKTPKENMQDSILHGVVRQPGQRPTHKLTEEEVAKIKSLLGTMPQAKIAAMFGVTANQISKIKCGENWKTGKKAFGGFRTEPWTHERRARYRSDGDQR